MAALLSKTVINASRSMATNAAIVSPVSNRFHFFNFFEKPNVDDEKFFEEWLKPGNYLKHKPEFVSMHLHHHSKGHAKHPWVNFVVVNTDESCLFGQPDPEWVELIKAGFKFGFLAKPAGYREISSLRHNQINDKSKLRPHSSKFILTAFEVEDSKCSKFEENWSSISGMDAIENEACFVDSILYKKFWSMIPTSFNYVVRSEVKDSDELVGQQLADNVEKSCQENKVDGVTSSTGIYSIHIDL